MAQLALSLSIILVCYLIGYAMGRKDIVNDIKEVTKEIQRQEDTKDTKTD